MKRAFTLFILSLFPFILFSQTAKISGIVSDKKTRETLVGANIILDSSRGVATNENGIYSIEVEPGEHVIEYKFIGYKSEFKTVRLRAYEELTVNIRLEDESKVLDEVVVSAGRFEQKISDVTVSMEIIRATMIENTNTQSIETVVQQVPGIMIMDDQASIRGGSSYSFGAGSRVLLLVDDMPMLSGAMGDIKWNFAPVENIEQIEVMKGASSALYGSSALNGVIHIRTKYPKAQPETKLMFSSGIYMDPKRKEIANWDTQQPIFTGTQFLHSRRIGNFDLVIGGNLFSDNGYRENDYEQRGRFNFNTRWRSKKIEGLSYGLNTNYMKWDGSKFLLWENGDTGVYKAVDSWDQKYFNLRVNVDPYITYFSPKGNRHSLKTRYFRTENHNSTNQNNDDNLYFAEYQFQKYLANNLAWTSGITGSYVESFSDIYQGNSHYGTSGAVYTQLDKKFKKLSASLGGRWETYRLGEEKSSSTPVFRSGLNYPIFEHTHLRTSFGQGFRYPSISEKYIESSIDALNVFPNPDLKPEKGWSAELGIKQGFQISNWSGYLDIAGFWTEYRDMIEFSFGYHFPDYLENQPFYHPDTVFKYIGFKAENVSNAQITGIDVTIIGQGSLFGIPTSLMAGYTYTNPVDMNIAPEDRLKTTKNSHVLKYRFYHSAKADFEMNLNNLYWGMSMDFFSFVINIDKAFEDTIRFPDRTVNGVVIQGQPIQYSTGEYAFILPGLKEYRDKNNKGAFVFDFRLGVSISEKSRISLVLRNALNKEYMIRPGDVQAPRTFALQYMLKV
ncbi:MAG: TonB-dependent receptor [Bacteroidales bacterium]|nr:TonB-dependent receptor [Bacteroidales bacterium]